MIDDPVFINDTARPLYPIFRYLQPDVYTACDFGSKLIAGYPVNGPDIEDLFHSYGFTCIDGDGGEPEYENREFWGDFAYFEVRGGYFGGWPRRTETKTFCLPEAIVSECEIDMSKTHSTSTSEGPLYGQGGPGFGIYVSTVNSPGGAQNASYTLNSTTGCLTSTVTVRAKRRMRGWYRGKHVIYARCPL